MTDTTENTLQNAPEPTDASRAAQERPSTAHPFSQMTREELMDALEQQNRQIEAIRRTSDALFSHRNVEAVIRATLEIALSVLRADAGSLMLHDPRTDTLICRYVIGGAGEKLVGKSISASQGIAGTVFRTRHPLLIRNVAERGDFNAEVDRETGYHTESMMTVPVKRTAGEPLGVMQVLNAHVAFTHRDLEVLEILCDQAATGIEHIRLTQEVKKSEIVHVIGDISHDIKNMLTPIMTGVWMLQPMLQKLFEDMDMLASRCPADETWGPELNRVSDTVRLDYGWLLENIVAAAEQVQTRTREIADAVKGELAAPLFEDNDFNELCRAVTATLKVVAERSRIRLLLDLDPNLPAVECDRKQMINALYNLVNNAIPFTPAGGSVTLRTRAPENGEDGFVCEVQDTGTGMPEQVRARLFTDDAISTTVGGTGLGTRYVGKVIKRHNGTITVQSGLGVGTTFTIRLPLRHVELTD